MSNKKAKKTGTSMGRFTNRSKESTENSKYKVSKAEKDEWKKLGWEPPNTVSEGRDKLNVSQYKLDCLYGKKRTKKRKKKKRK